MKLRSGGVEWTASALSEERPFDGALESLDGLFDFQPTFALAMDKVRSPDSNTRVALHELVCILSTRLHVEREVLVPLLEARAGEIGYQRPAKPFDRRIERLLVVIDRRHPSSPDMPDLVASLEMLVLANIDHHEGPAAACRAALGREEALEVHHRLVKAVDGAVTRPHPHLPHQGPLATVSRLVAFRVDRLRNLTHVR